MLLIATGWWGVWILGSQGGLCWLFSLVYMVKEVMWCVMRVGCSLCGPQYLKLQFRFGNRKLQKYYARKCAAIIEEFPPDTYDTTATADILTIK